MTRPTIQEALDDAVRSLASQPVRRPSAAPMAPVPLALGTGGIVLAALVIAASVGGVAALILYARLGADGFADFRTEWRFDPILQAKLDALKISALYTGVIVATLTAALLRGGRRGWPSLVAAGPGRWHRGVVPIALVTLVYAALFTLAHVVGRERHLLSMGPTDYVLLGTLSANLVVLAPLAEELVFRGWLYTGLRARWRFLSSFLATAGTFAAAHWFLDPLHVLRVLPLALALGLLREFTGSIRPTITLHAAYNFVIVAITLAAA